MTVERHLAEPLRRHLGLGAAEIRARQEELLELVALPRAMLTRYPFELSGGQQQRVALAIGLACSPQILILDEPTTGLDVTTQAEIMRLLLALVETTGVGVLLVSHDLTLLSFVTSRLAVMYAGEIVESGATHSLVNAARHPYSRRLFACSPRIDDPRLAEGIQGSPPHAVVRDACAFMDRCAWGTARCTHGHPVLREIEEHHLVRCVRAEDLGVEEERTIWNQRPRDGARVDTLLEVNRLSCFYENDTAVVCDVSFSVESGETVAIVGESGSGKSTMLRAIAGLHDRWEGSIALQGVPLHPRVEKRPRRFRGDIQLIFQNPDSSLNPRHRVARIVERPIQLLQEHVSSGDRRARTRELLHAVKLPPSAGNRYPWELSSGQKQRIAIARAFAAQPVLLLCDEVTSALDVSVQATILNLIAELAEGSNAAVLFVTHDLAIARGIASRTLVVRDGVVVEHGITENLFSDPRHPYTRELLSAAVG
jgi:peptide/nickel transport system ATP-binding protein